MVAKRKIIPLLLLRRHMAPRRAELSHEQLRTENREMADIVQHVKVRGPGIAASIRVTQEGFSPRIPSLERNLLGMRNRMISLGNK